MAFILQYMKRAGLSRAATLGDMATLPNMVRVEPTPHDRRILFLKRKLEKELKIFEQKMVERDLSIKVLKPYVPYKRLVVEWAKTSYGKLRKLW